MSPEEEESWEANRGGATLSPTSPAPEQETADLGRRDRQAESRENGQVALVAELSVELLGL